MKSLPKSHTASRAGRRSDGAAVSLGDCVQQVQPSRGTRLANDVGSRAATAPPIVGTVGIEESEGRRDPVGTWGGVERSPCGDGGDGRRATGDESVMDAAALGLPPPKLPPAFWSLLVPHEARFLVLDPIEGRQLSDGSHVDDRRIITSITDEITEPLRLPDHLDCGVLSGGRIRCLDEASGEEPVVRGFPYRSGSWYR
jgi:hypothetical protein